MLEQDIILRGYEQTPWGFTKNLPNYQLCIWIYSYSSRYSYGVNFDDDTNYEFGAKELTIEHIDRLEKLAKKVYTL
jgi:hypothetical protein